MCGITGIISTNEKLTKAASEAVTQMNAALNHRGPDSIGSYHDHSCALAMSRLSIIDIEGGDQPIFNESGDILVFQNGEIYNYRELRALLEKKGHTFRTQSDTEVLVHLYEEYDEDMCTHLKGMFAFCLYDKARQRVLLARDRFGEKPLYYWQNNHNLAFASELGALLQYKQIPRKLNREGLAYYLRTSLLPEPVTLFQDIHSLPAGHYLKIENGKTTVRRYYTIDYSSTPIKSLGEAREKVEPVLIAAVKSQMVSDVPIGAFLSGGIDSSSMVALMQQQSAKAIQTFNVKFEDQAYDESPIARKVASHCGTDHHEITIPNEEFTEDIFWKIIDHMGQPFRDSSAIPTFFVSQAIRQHVKVAISGDGGDELFGGYDLFQWYTRINSLKSIPRPLISLMAGGANLMQPAFAKSSKLRQANRALKTAKLTAEDIAISLNEMFTEAEILDLLEEPGTRHNGNSYALLKDYPAAAEGWSPLRKIMYYRMKHTLPANMLVKVDRMSMANSLEVRAPFLDPDLAAIAARLSDDLLVNNGTGKYLLREIMKAHLPEEVFSHPKQGFNIPLHKYQNKAYRELAQRLLFDENPLPGLFNQITLKHVFEQGLQVRTDSSKISVFRASHQLWMIMQFLGWAKKFNVKMSPA